MSRAACEAWNFTDSRSPKKRNVRTWEAAAEARATATVPTGFSADLFVSLHADGNNSTRARGQNA